MGAPGRTLGQVLDEAAAVHDQRARMRLVVATRAGRGHRPAAQAAAAQCVDLTRQHAQLQREALVLFDRALEAAP